MRIESYWYGSEGTTKSDTTNGYFANEAFTVWFSDFTKIFRNIVLKYILIIPAYVLVHYNITTRQKESQQE